MSSDDSEENRRRKLDVKRRVTLNMAPISLALPGEPPVPDPGERSSLAIPLPAPRPGTRPNSSVPPPQRTADGWQLDRIHRSTLPPPPDRPSQQHDISSLPPLDENDELQTEPQGDALELADRARHSVPELRSFADEMDERFALGDFTGALQIAELVLGRDPKDAMARRVADSARTHLVALYTSRLGSLDGVPSVMVPEADVRWLGLDPRAASVLAHVDGRRAFSDIVRTLELDELEALKVLAELLTSGTIRVR